MARKQKDHLKKLLRQAAWQDIRGWAQETRRPLRSLFSITYDDDVLVRYRAIESIGLVALDRSPYQLDKIRTFLRGLLWLMNDESGGLGWFAPQTVAEIVFRVEALRAEYAPLLPQFLKMVPFERATHEALARLAACCTPLILEQADELLSSLDDSSPHIRYYALLALLALQQDPRFCAQPAWRAKREALLVDRQEVIVYDYESHQLRKGSIASVARVLDGDVSVVS